MAGAALSSGNPSLQINEASIKAIEQAALRNSEVLEQVYKLIQNVETASSLQRLARYDQVVADIIKASGIKQPVFISFSRIGFPDYADDRFFNIPQKNPNYLAINLRDESGRAYSLVLNEDKLRGIERIDISKHPQANEERAKQIGLATARYLGGPNISRIIVGNGENVFCNAVARLSGSAPDDSKIK